MRVDLALLLQSKLSLSLDQLHKIIKKNPSDLSECLDFLPQQQQVELLQTTKTIEHQKLKEKILQTQIQLCFYGELNYPHALLNWPNAPQILWYLGQPIWNQLKSLAVVGSRHPSSETVQWLTWHLSDFFKQRPAVLVSGGACGTDQVAHWLAVRENVPTVALMPVGLLNRYPPSYFRLETSLLARGGATLSPFLPNWPLHKANFARRNQVIAALSKITFIAEARRRSGTLLTAQAAVYQGKPLAVLPCSPLRPQGLGGLDLLSEGAQVIRDSQDLVVLWDRHH